MTIVVNLGEIHSIMEYRLQTRQIRSPQNHTMCVIDLSECTRYEESTIVFAIPGPGYKINYPIVNI